MSSSPEVMSLIEPLMLNFCWAKDPIVGSRQNSSSSFFIDCILYGIDWQIFRINFLIEGLIFLMRKFLWLKQKLRMLSECD
jgi:hypothetical protein